MYDIEKVNHDGLFEKNHAAIDAENLDIFKLSFACECFSSQRCYTMPEGFFSSGQNYTLLMKNNTCGSVTLYFSISYN